LSDVVAAEVDGTIITPPDRRERGVRVDDRFVRGAVMAACLRFGDQAQARASAVLAANARTCKPAGCSRRKAGTAIVSNQNVDKDERRQRARGWSSDGCIPPAERTSAAYCRTRSASRWLCYDR
jgi:hypothetical protein